MAEASVDALFVSFQQALLGRYSLERELGRGGMGVVYLAREVRLDRRIAIKLLPPELAAVPSLRDRFMREARTAAALSHPYIVPIHTVDETDGFAFYVMAYVNGETLLDRVKHAWAHEARAAAERRLAEVVTALETLRLDLLRLQAGAGSADSITQNLLAARALGEDVDRLLAGQREVEKLSAFGSRLSESRER